jgi:hypothetical protein
MTLNLFYTLSDIKKRYFSFLQKKVDSYIFMVIQDVQKTSWACKMALTYMAMIASGNGFNNKKMFLFVLYQLFLAQQKRFQ